MHHHLEGGYMYRLLWEGVIYRGRYQCKSVWESSSKGIYQEEEASLSPSVACWFFLAWRHRLRVLESPLEWANCILSRRFPRRHTAPGTQSSPAAGWDTLAVCAGTIGAAVLQEWLFVSWDLPRAIVRSDPARIDLNDLANCTVPERCVRRGIVRVW